MGALTAPTGFALVGPAVAAGMLLVQGSPSGMVLSPRNQPNSSLALCYALLMRRKRGVSAGAHAKQMESRRPSGYGNGSPA